MWTDGFGAWEPSGFVAVLGVNPGAYHSKAGRTQDVRMAQEKSCEALAVILVSKQPVFRIRVAGLRRAYAGRQIAIRGQRHHSLCG
jgi:hypothetical protein